MWAGEWKNLRAKRIRRDAGSTLKLWGLRGLKLYRACGQTGAGFLKEGREDESVGGVKCVNLDEVSESGRSTAVEGMEGNLRIFSIRHIELGASGGALERGRAVSRVRVHR